MPRRATRPGAGSILRAPFLRRIELVPARTEPHVFPFTLPFLQGGSFHLDFTEPVTIFVGENGTGKSTLLEAIAALCGFNLLGGSRDNRFGEPEDDAALRLAGALRASWLPKLGTGFLLRAESFYNFPRYIEAAYRDANEVSPYGRDHEMHRLSHGEMLLDFIGRRFGHETRAIYLLDEPEAALSPARQIELVALIDRGRRSGNVQYVIATHSPLVMAFPDAQLLAFDARVRPTRLADTPHMRLYEELMRDPRGYVTAAIRAIEVSEQAEISAGSTSQHPR
jgi:predicted ATPase